MKGLLRADLIRIDIKIPVKEKAEPFAALPSHKIVTEYKNQLYVLWIEMYLKIAINHFPPREYFSSFVIEAYI
jgi:hypothetical protein